MAVESKYIKLKFKYGKITICIWGAIALGVKSPIQSLEIESNMNSDIYINQVLEELGLPFYKKCFPEKRSMIWIDNSANYHMSKIITEYHYHVGPIRID